MEPEQKRVVFEGENLIPTYAPKAPTGFAGLLIKWGLAKDENQAQLSLLFLGIAALTISLFIWFSGGDASSGGPPAIPPM